MRALLAAAVLAGGGVAFAQTGASTPSTRVLTQEDRERVERMSRAAGWTLGTVAAAVGAWLVGVMIPPVIASARGQNNTASIFLVSLFLGWTCLGWVWALVWAFSDNTKATDRRRYGRRR